METVEPVDLFQQAGAFATAKAEHVHRLIAHTQEFGHQRRICGLQAFGVEGLLIDKCGTSHIEPCTCREILYVRHESQKTREAKQEYQMEVGK